MNERTKMATALSVAVASVAFLLGLSAHFQGQAVAERLKAQRATERIDRANNLMNRLDVQIAGLSRRERLLELSIKKGLNLEYRPDAFIVAPRQDRDGRRL